MTFLHPGFLYAAAGAAAIVVALHFLVAEQHRAGILPTVRFFPDVQVRATALTVRWSDLLLLLIRALTLLLIGAAFAQPQLSPTHSAILRILLVDISRDVGRASEAGDSAARYVSGSASVITFDSAATEIAPGSLAKGLQAVRSEEGSARRRGSLSSALIVALRAASRLRSGADSLDLALVSPLLAEELDSATLAIRSAWPGRIHLVPVAAARDSAHPERPAKVEWADSSNTGRWTARSRPDTIGGVRFGGGMLIYPFVRKWALARVDSADRIVARWVDGEPAIVETASASGCVRSISVPIPTAGDAILRPSFARFFEGIGAPCPRSRSYLPLSAAEMSRIAGPAHLAPADRIAPEVSRMTPLVPWLLVSALVLSLFELIVRRVGERRGAQSDDDAAEEAAGEIPTVRIA